MIFSQSTHLLMFLSLESLTFIIRNDLPILVELINLLNTVTISNDLTQMVNFPTWIPDCDSHSPALFDLFLSFDANICSDCVVVSVSFDLPSNSQQDALFHCIAYDYSCADWNSLRDNSRDVPWEDIFKLGAFPAASDFYVWVQGRVDG